MAKTLKRIDAGGIQVAALYNRCGPRDTPKQRQVKHQASSAAQRRMNQIYSYEKLELMLAKNFPTPGSGLWVTLTYDDKHLPKRRSEAQLRFKYFLQKLRKARKAAGLQEPVVFWAPEVLTSKSGRWHQHVVLDNTGQDYDMLRSCWIYGSEVAIAKLQRPKPGEDVPEWYEPDGDEPDNYYKALAKYMTKELREAQEYESKPGLHGWSCTRNAQRPEVDTMTVPDDYELEPPEGSTVLLDESKRTEYAAFRVIKYRFSGAGFAPAPRARRRRPKHKR